MQARTSASTLAALRVAGGVLCGGVLAAAPLAAQSASQLASPAAASSAAATSAAPSSASSATPAPSAPLSSPELDAARAAAQLGLQLAIQENGPDRPWRMTIRNTGVDPVTLAADGKLLFFEVEVPGQKKIAQCTLPEAMRKGGPNGLLKLPLEPGEVLTRHIDPRFYCFEEGEQSVLVPGSIVKARYGWPQETKTSWKKGKRVTEVLPPAPPFVATPLSEAAAVAEQEPEHGSGHVGEALDDATPATANAGNAPTHGVRLLEGNALALGSQYAAWSLAGLGSAGKDPIRVRVTRGSDAETERGVTVTVSLVNQSDAPLNLFFRRELVSFEVLGPNGAATCRIEEDFREPERQAFLRLSPGKEQAFVSRLVELCPRGTFLEPGFYLVGATLHARYAGERFELHAFVGEVPSLHPKPVRVRKREDPFLTPAPPAFRSSTAAAPAAVPVPAPAPPPPPAPVEGG